MPPSPWLVAALSHRTTSPRTLTLVISFTVALVLLFYFRPIELDLRQYISIPTLSEPPLPPIPGFSSHPQSLPFEVDSPVAKAALQAFQHSIRAGHIVAVINESVESHKEVHAALLWTLTRIPGLDIRFYTPKNPHEEGHYSREFDELIRHFWKPNQTLDIRDFLQDMRSTPRIRHVIMTTGQWGLVDLGGELTKIWDERKEEEKFTVAAVHHSIRHTEDFSPFASRASMGIITLSEEVARRTREQLKEKAAVVETEEEAQGLKETPVKLIVPYFQADVGGRRHIGQAVAKEGGLNDAVIESLWWSNSRDLNKVYNDLWRQLQQNETAWGYTWRNTSYHPIQGRADRFILHLPGSIPAPHPRELENVLQLHVGLPNHEFYNLLSEMDVMMPAFRGDEYVTEKASSVVGVAASVNIPIVADKAMEEAYGYLCSASVTIRLDGISEIDHIAKVRSGEIPWMPKEERQRESARCQEDWTAHNKMVMAELLGLTKSL